MAALFNLSIAGAPPGAGTVATSEWIDMGAIPTGLKLWFGSMRLTSPNKSITFELRSNLAGQSAGTIGATKLLGKATVSAKSGTLTLDLYQKGRLHTATVVGTGTERWWINLISKGAVGSYLYQAFYTTE